MAGVGYMRQQVQDSEAGSGVDDHAHKRSLSEAAPAVNRIEILEDGPLIFHAPLRVECENAGYSASICRCGASANKPFCDGRHLEAGFKDDGEPAVQNDEQLCARTGDVQVDLVSNGPLQVKGPVEIVSASGRVIDCAKKVYLCRCGASANKPYCDGSHRSARFRG